MKEENKNAKVEEEHMKREKLETVDENFHGQVDKQKDDERVSRD